MRGKPGIALGGALLAALLLLGAGGTNVSLAPAAVEKGGITLEKTAERGAGGVWRVTLRVDIDDAPWSRMEHGTVRDTQGGAFAYSGTAREKSAMEWQCGAHDSFSYTLRFCRTDGFAQGEACALGETALLWSEDGVWKSMAFPRAAARCFVGTLRVTSTGLPGDAQPTDTGPVLVTPTARFAVPRPQSVSGYRLSYVRVDGAVRSAAEFEAQYAYRLPVVPGERKVEYVYEKIPARELWHYRVDYYLDGVRDDSLAYTGSVEKRAPVVDSVPDRLPQLARYYENPVCRLPVTLARDGETINVYYVSVPRSGKNILVYHTYLADAAQQEGASVSVPSLENGVCGLASLWQTAYGANAYTPIAAAVTRVADGDKTAETVMCAPDGIFLYDAGSIYTVQLVYSRDTLSLSTRTDAAAASPLAAAGETRFRRNTPAVFACAGLFSALCAVLLQAARRRL